MRRSARDALAGIDVKLRGRFNVENALGAFAAARLLGIADDAIARGIESVRGVPGRFESVDEGQPFTVIVDYAHKPGALENVLRAARDLAGRRARDLRRRSRRRPRPRQAADHGPARVGARRHHDRHVGQSAQRGSAGDHRRDRRRRRGRGRRRARPRRGDRARDRARARRRCRADRGQGRRAGSGARRSHDPVRRPRGGARRAARPWQPRA